MAGTDAATNAASRRVSVLFVCLGNICRSPMAGAIFAQMVKTRGLQEHFDRIESAGTGDYHIGAHIPDRLARNAHGAAGEEPDERTVAICERHGVPVTSVAQQAVAAHFDEFDYILAMDRNNLANLQRIKPAGSKAKLSLLGDFGDGKPVQDPYYGPRNGFSVCYEQCQSGCEGLLESMGFADQPGGNSRKRAAKA